MFRREWRQQLLVVTLLTVAVDGRDRQRHGRLQHQSAGQRRARLGRAPAQVRRQRSAQARGRARRRRRRFGTSEVIGHRSVAVPGSVETVDFRAQDPHGALRQRAARTPPAAATRPAPTRSPSPTASAKLLRLRARLDAGARRGPAPNRRRDRREPAQAERRVRPRRSLVRPGAGPRDGSDERERTTSIDSFTDSPDRERIGVQGLRGAAGTTRRRTRWRCSRSPPSSCSWPRWSPPRPSRSSHSAAAPTRHARRRRRHAEAPATRAADQRRPRRHDRRARRHDRRPRTSGSPSPRRSSPRPTIASTGSASPGSCSR